MATWMVHFRIAENLLKLGLEGSGKELPDKENKIFIPPKQVTHFKIDNKTTPSLFAEQYLLNTERECIR